MGSLFDFNMIDSLINALLDDLTAMATKMVDFVTGAPEGDYKGIMFACAIMLALGILGFVPNLLRRLF